MAARSAASNVGRIQQRILLIRGTKVVIDADLATFYGVTTRRLNEQVKRNASRFPGDFAFRLTIEEKTEVVAKCDHLASLKFSKTLPLAFSEHGALMAASVLNTSLAVEMSVFVGIHPVFTQVPPNLWRSIIATVIPAPLRRAAKDGPA